jgi:phosphatidylserine/phosphatidylglycerophosphate/cardiolipin synthase-like enzyme
MDVTSQTLLRPGSNCSRIAKADRFAMLVDGSGYYSALADTIPRAQRTVAIVGWDLDTRARLGPSGGDGPLLPPLREWLRSVADANPALEIYILTWDFPVIFANVRDPLLVREQDPFEHPRIHLHFDSEHPPGASHHQKLVVVDDCLAFFGGMDIAGGRWDTPEHRHHDIRRGGGGPNRTRRTTTSRRWWTARPPACWPASSATAGRAPPARRWRRPASRGISGRQASSPTSSMRPSASRAPTSLPTRRWAATRSSSCIST